MKVILPNEIETLVKRINAILGTNKYHMVYQDGVYNLAYRHSKNISHNMFGMEIDKSYVFYSHLVAFIKGLEEYKQFTREGV